MTFRTALIVSILAVALTAGTGVVRALAAGDAEKGRTRAFLCAACHGMTGKSDVPDMPHLAGQKQAYLAAQMKSFRRSAAAASPGRRQARHDIVMSQQATRLSDADMENLAAYFAVQPCPAGKAAAGGPIPPAARRCVACHGNGGRSVSPTVPHLAGQQERYLENQLRAFRDRRGGESKERRYRLHPMMGRQVKRIGDKDIAALARYFAGQPCE